MRPKAVPQHELPASKGPYLTKAFFCLTRSINPSDNRLVTYGDCFHTVPLAKPGMPAEVGCVMVVEFSVAHNYGSHDVTIIRQDDPITIVPFFDETVTFEEGVPLVEFSVGIVIPCDRLGPMYFVVGLDGRMVARFPVEVFESHLSDGEPKVFHA